MKTKIKKKTKKNNLGFSLIEVLLAVVLLAIVMVPLMQAVLSSMSINAKSRKLMAANDCAQTLIEHFEGMTHDEIKTMLTHSGTNGVSIPFLLEPDGDFYNPYTADCYTLGTMNETQGKSTFFSNLNIHPNEKRAAYCNSCDCFFLGNVEYTEDKYFDVAIKMSLAPNCSESDKYHIYTVTISVYDTDYRSTTPHSEKNHLVTLSGSTFNKFEF